MVRSESKRSPNSFTADHTQPTAQLDREVVNLEIEITSGSDYVYGQHFSLH